MLTRYLRDDPGAAPGLQRPGAHHPPRRPAGHRLHPRHRPSTARRRRLDDLGLRRASPGNRLTLLGPVPSSGGRPRPSASTSTCPFCAAALRLLRLRDLDRPPPPDRRATWRPAAPTSTAVAAGTAAGDQRVRRRRHAVAGARPTACWPCSAALPAGRRRRGDRRVQPRHRRRRAAATPTAPAASNRLSLGVQSMVPHVLAALGRTHDPANVRRRVELARAAGSRRSTSTSSTAAAGESLDDWQPHARRGPGARAAARVSAYALTVEAGHAAGRRPRPPPRRRRPGRQVRAGRRAA